MFILSLTCEDFFTSLEDVNEILSDETECNRFLDKTRAKVPVIAAILEQIAALEMCPDSSQKEKGLIIAQRDLTVLLALHYFEAYLDPPLK